MNGTRAPALALAAAVAVAFADSSIVVLALPELLSDFDSSIPAISWVITGYNLVLAAAALVLARRGSRLEPRRATVAGLVVFLVASAGCAAAPELVSLVVMRCVQGLGAALLVVGALPLLVALAGTSRRGTEAWILAGAVGTAVGPALGGALTEAFDWRAIFVAQAPVAAVALVPALRVRASTEPHVPGAGSGRMAVAAAGLGLVSAALAGALFLAVILLVDVWRLSPLAAAGVVTALPAGAVAGGRLAAAVRGAEPAAAGATVLAGGLLGLALLPSSSLGLAVWALLLCGAGLGLALPYLSRASLLGHRLAATGAWSVAARHAGLVLALVVVAPLLARSTGAGAERAAVASAAVVLDAPISASTKIGLALDLNESIEEAPSWAFPDLESPFERRSGEGVQALRDDLFGAIDEAITRSFRSSFAVSALFGLLALLPIALLRREWER